MSLPFPGDEQEDIRRRLFSSLPPGKQPFDLRVLNTDLMARADADTRAAIHEEFCFRAGLTGKMKIDCPKHSYRICTECIGGVPVAKPGQPQDPRQTGKTCTYCGGRGRIMQPPEAVFVCLHVMAPESSDTKPVGLVRTRKGFLVCRICAGLWERKKFDPGTGIVTACKRCCAIELSRLRMLDPALVADNADSAFTPLTSWSVLDLGDGA
jgi:hypothetical protein